MNEDFLTVDEFSKILGLHRKTILRYIKKGLVRGFQVNPGRRCPYKIHKSEILRIESEGIMRNNPRLGGEGE